MDNVVNLATFRIEKELGVKDTPEEVLLAIEDLKQNGPYIEYRDGERMPSTNLADRTIAEWKGLVEALQTTHTYYSAHPEKFPANGIQIGDETASVLVLGYRELQAHAEFVIRQVAKLAPSGKNISEEDAQFEHAKLQNILDTIKNQPDFDEHFDELDAQAQGTGHDHRVAAMRTAQANVLPITINGVKYKDCAQIEARQAELSSSFPSIKVHSTSQRVKQSIIERAYPSANFRPEL